MTFVFSSAGVLESLWVLQDMLCDALNFNFIQTYSKAFHIWKLMYQLALQDPWKALW